MYPFYNVFIPYHFIYLYVLKKKNNEVLYIQQKQNKQRTQDKYMDPD